MKMKDTFPMDNVRYIPNFEYVRCDNCHKGKMFILSEKKRKCDTCGFTRPGNPETERTTSDTEGGVFYLIKLKE